MRTSKFPRQKLNDRWFPKANSQHILQTSPQALAIMLKVLPYLNVLMFKKNAAAIIPQMDLEYL